MARHTTIADDRFLPLLKFLSKHTISYTIGLITPLPPKKSPGSIRIKLTSLPRTNTTRITLIGNKYKQIFWSNQTNQNIQLVLNSFLQTKPGNSFEQKI